MDPEDMSVSSEGQRTPTIDLSHRPILKPKSRKDGGRSPSPTRRLLTLLEQANPSVRCCQPGSGVEMPPRVVELRTSLMKDLGMKVIPRGLVDRLRAADPDGFDSIPVTAFNDDTNMSAEAIDKLWETVRSIYTEAERCNNHHKDENAWVEVVRSVWKAALGPFSNILEINSI